MKRKLEIRRGKIRYWAHGPQFERRDGEFTGRCRFVFYSSHRWPFYHGSRIFDRQPAADEVMRVLMEWVPGARS